VAIVTEIRPARREDLDEITAIEGEADQAFVPLFGPLDWRPTPGVDRIAAPGFLLVADEPVAGFAHVLELEQIVHLEQLAVRPSMFRRGIGTALVRAAMAEAARRGYAEISLCTYADVAWNAPFYRLLGFEEVVEPGPLHRRMREHEQRIGLDRHGRRVVMEAPTGSGSI
jgi:ribosomal protein S18 acetylase RimI-like enzyme